MTLTPAPKSDELHDRLAKAVSDEEAQELLLEASRIAFPDDEDEAAIAISEIASGQPAGWIGIGMLMVPEGWEWQLSNRAPKPMQGRAYIHNRELIYSGGGFSRNPKYRGEECTAMRPDCALVLAALRAMAGGR